MKKNFALKIMSLWMIISSGYVFAQTGINYKALITENGAVLANHSVNFRFTVLENGTTQVYQETQTATTDANGIVSVHIGEGTVVSGDFSTIDWGLSQFLKVEIDTGSGYTDFGTTELKFVPKAKYAEKAGSVSNISIDDLSDGKYVDNSLFLGFEAGDQTTNNNLKNTGVGHQALKSNTTGFWNSAFGYKVLFTNTTGSGNTANGWGALYANTTGDYNTASGNQALYSNTIGEYNTANGNWALHFNTTGSWNTANGNWALYSNTMGHSNVAIGTSALFYNTDRSNLVAVGDSALYHNGQGATASYDATANTAIGSKALYANTTGDSNTATGYKALYSNTTGYYNTSSGFQSLYSNTTGGSNTAIGVDALKFNTTGYLNTALGYKAFINGTNHHNSTALGYYAHVSASNQIRLGNSSVTSIGGYANWTNVSDARFKKDVQENVPGLDFITRLRPVTYHLDMDAIARFNKTPDSLRSKADERLKAAIVQTGFIAQEVEQAAREIGYDFSGVDAPKNPNDHYGLRYAEFVVPLVKAVQELHAENQRLRKQNTLMEKRLAELEQRISELENSIRDHSRAGN